MSAQQKPNNDLADSEASECVESEKPGKPIDPRLDPEAMLLSSLLAVEAGADGEGLAVADAGYVLDYLHPRDFSQPSYGRIFTLMKGQMADGKLITPAAISARIEATADTDGWGGTTPQLRLLSLYELGGLPAQITYYADEVLSASYRRQYQAMVTSLQQASQQAGEADLFPLLVEHGTAQRRAWRRRTRFLASAPSTSTPETDTEDHEEKPAP